MSNPLPLPTGLRRKIEHRPPLAIPPLPAWYSRHDARSPFSSSPERSSSPPMTPFSTRTNHHHAHIQSSPRMSFEQALHDLNDHTDDFPSTWDRHYIHNHTSKNGPTYSLPSFKSTFPNEGPFSPFASEFSEDADARFDDFRSEASDGAPAHGSLYDSENEESQDQEEGYSFVDTRATCFRTSAERGRWKSDPMPFQLQSRVQMRKSAPTSSSPSTPTVHLPERPISEPAPSSLTREKCPSREQSELPLPISRDSTPLDDFNTLESESLPPLSSDRDSSIEVDETSCHPSPLPPSSPPLSPMSFSVSPMIGSVSPLSFSLSSPLPTTTSPLKGDANAELRAIDDATQPHQVHIQRSSIEANVTILPGLEAEIKAEVTPTLLLRDVGFIRSAPAILSELRCDLTSAPVSDPSADGSTSVGSEQQSLIFEAISSSSVEDSSPLGGCGVDVDLKSRDAVKTEPFTISLHESSVKTTEDGEDVTMIAELQPITLPEPEHRPHLIDGSKEEDRALKVKEYNGIVISSVQEEAPQKLKPSIEEPIKQAGLSVAREKRKKERVQEKSNDGPVKKKARTIVSKGTSMVETSDGAKTPRKSRVLGDVCKKGKRKMEEENELSDPGSSSTVPRKSKKQRVEGAKQAKPRRLSSSSPSSDPTPSAVARRSCSNNPLLSDAMEDMIVESSSTTMPDAEICGMLIECMATSRASSLPISALYKSLMQSRPALKAQQGEKEWITAFDRVLRSGEAGRGSGVFGKVDSSGKDDSDRPLAAQWFYVPELDEDQDRATLIRSMMPRPGKRSETKKYKQYYYRPLDKISRWDPEDEM